MKTVKSAADLRQMALTKGAEVVSGGARFNSERQAVNLLPPKPRLPAPEPAPDTMTRQEFERRLAERDAAWSAEMDRIAATFAAALQAVRQEPVPPVDEWNFDVQYDERNKIAQITARATKS